MIDLMRGALALVAVAAGFGAFWAGALMLDKQRTSGRRYWLINPAAQIDSLFSKECGLSLACLLVAIAAAMLRDAIQ
jgi:hypothetical protein